VDEIVKQQLHGQFAGFDPLALLSQIRTIQQELLLLSNHAPTVTVPRNNRTIAQRSRPPGAAINAWRTDGGGRCYQHWGGDLVRTPLPTPGPWWKAACGRAQPRGRGTADPADAAVAPTSTPPLLLAAAGSGAGLERDVAVNRPPNAKIGAPVTRITQGTRCAHLLARTNKRRDVYDL
jgi:hypothetical protein